MLAEAAGVKRIILACGRTDLRKGIDGLAQLIGTKYDLNPFEKDVLFLFCGCRTDRIKGLLWEGTGFLLLYKRLEDGSFSWPRTPEEAARFSKTARENGFGAVIAAAGMAAHLAGAVAANTTLPVIGIPIKSGNLGGIDALLSTVQMPSGIPVATVAIDGAVNAALLCIESLSVTDGDLAEKLEGKRKADAEKVLEKNAAIEKEFN